MFIPSALPEPLPFQTCWGEGPGGHHAAMQLMLCTESQVQCALHMTHQHMAVPARGQSYTVMSTWGRMYSMQV